MKQDPEKVDVKGLVITLLVLAFILLVILGFQPPRY